MPHIPNHLTTLISFLKKLPGVGRKTAERFAFQILNWSDNDVTQFAKHLEAIKKNLSNCSKCGALIEKNTCPYCDHTKRDEKILCIVANPKDIFSFEEMRIFNGQYHVLGGLLSPLDGLDTDQLELDKLKKRIAQSKTKEVIIALGSTLEADATALLVNEHLKDLDVHVSKLAYGLPLGSSLDFVDEGTLNRAFSGRHCF